MARVATCEHLSCATCGAKKPGATAVLADAGHFFEMARPRDAAGRTRELLNCQRNADRSVVSVLRGRLRACSVHVLAWQPHLSLVWVDLWVAYRRCPFRKLLQALFWALIKNAVGLTPLPWFCFHM